jgi:hypothetical protein
MTKPLSSCERFSDRIDIFTESIPQLNFEGRKKISTSIGVLWTCIVLIAIFFYALIKTLDLVNGNDPIVNKDYEYGKYLNEEDGLNLTKYTTI